MLRRIAMPLAAAMVLCAVWQAVASLHTGVLGWLWTRFDLQLPVPSLRFLSSPFEVVAAFPRELRAGLPIAVWQTLHHAVVAAALAFLIGVPVAEWLRRNGPVARSCRPLIRGLNGIPPVTLLPVFLVAFGLGGGSVIALAVFGASLSVTAIVLNASSHLSPDLAQMTGKTGYSRWGTLFWRLSYMSTALSSAMHEGLRWSLILVVVAEMHGTVAGGLGAYVDYARLNQSYSGVYIGIVSCGVLSFVLHKLADFLGVALHRSTIAMLLAGQTADLLLGQPHIRIRN